MQNFEKINLDIKNRFVEFMKEKPETGQNRLNFSWSNWGFGLEPLERSLSRLAKYDIRFIELHGNHYTPDLGYRVKETKQMLSDYGIEVSGVCGMFSADNDLSSNHPIHRQAAIDYIRREAEFCREIGARYLLICPAAVGRPQKYDDSEIHRSLEALAIAADALKENNVRGAIEPIRSAETSIVHTVAQANAYIDALNHPGVQHINGDVYHMLSEERHVPEAVLQAGSRLTNLHLADSNRCALGDGCLDLDNIIRALYLIGYDNPSCFVTPEPLGPGGDPYPAQNAITPPELLDVLVEKTVTYFREREEAIFENSDCTSLL